jgi:hypothetical protein
MRQDGTAAGGQVAPHRQNGITTGHLGEADRTNLPYCMQFSDLLTHNLSSLCPLLGADPATASEIEINAMAYGAGAWLSPHTDFFEYREDENRLAAWMLYLTDPVDGEWSEEKGGVVRVWKPRGREERIRPRFNRFVMFLVNPDSYHEIEKILWEPEWPNCRLALSGWILGHPAENIDRKTRMYLQSASAKERNEKFSAYIQGSLALHRLLEKQKKFCGRDIRDTRGRISELEEDYQAHLDSPDGTSFLRRIPGPAGCIVVVNESGDIVHFGTTHQYKIKTDALPKSPSK